MQKPTVPPDGMFHEHPMDWDVCTKRNTKHHTISRTGYLHHIRMTDGGIATSCNLTSTFVRGGQAAIPLIGMASERKAQRANDQSDPRTEGYRIRTTVKRVNRGPKDSPCGHHARLAMRRCSAT